MRMYFFKEYHFEIWATYLPLVKNKIKQKAQI